MTHDSHSGYNSASAKSFIEKAITACEREAWPNLHHPSSRFLIIATSLFGTRTLSRLRQLTPKQFAQVVAILLKHLGASDVKILDQTGDGGIDGEGEITSLNAKVAFQAKKWTTTNIGAPIVRDFAGALSLNKVECGIFATTSNFTDPAKAEASKPGSNIILLNGLQIVRLLLAKGLGVKVDHRNRDLVTEDVDEEFFANLGA